MYSQLIFVAILEMGVGAFCKQSAAPSKNAYRPRLIYCLDQEFKFSIELSRSVLKDSVWNSSTMVQGDLPVSTTRRPRRPIHIG